MAVAGGCRPFRAADGGAFLRVGMVRGEDCAAWERERRVRVGEGEERRGRGDSVGEGEESARGMETESRAE